MMMRSAAARRIAFRNIAEHGDRIGPDDALHLLDGVLNADYEGGLPIFATAVEPYDDPGVPVVIACPQGDRLLPSPTYTDAWRNAAPFATWWWLDGVGHVPMYDDPALVARLIGDWVTAASR